jgi:hypothetical protein
MATTVSGGALNITLSAIDGITAPLARINASTLRVQNSFARLGQNIGRVSGMNAMAAGARNVARSMAQIVPPLGALTAAGSVAGITHLASRWASFGVQLGHTAYRVQTSIAGLLTLQGAARLAGVSAEDLSAGMEGLGDALSDAVGGRDSTALQYFTLLGVAMRDARGNARTAAEALPQVADGIARIADPRLQARVMSALRLPASMLPFLKKGSAGLREWEADARRFGVITEQGAEAAQKFDLAQTRLRMAGEGLVNTIAQRLAPVMSPLLDRLTNWIAANREIIGQRVEEVVTRLAGAVERFVADGGLQKILGGLEGMWKGIQTVIEWMGGWEKAAIAFGAVLTLQMLAPLTGIVGALAVIGAFRMPAWMLTRLAPALLTAPGVAAGAGIAAGVGGERALNWALGNDHDEYQRRRQEGREQGWNQITGWMSRLQQALTPGPRQPSQQPRSYTGEEATARQRRAYQYFLSQGWSEAQATGLVANLRHESGAILDHQARGDGGRAYGIAQWHPDRQQNFRLWSGKHIQNSSLEEQLAFVQFELTQGQERAAGGALRNARTPAEAAGVVSRQYERPANREGEAAARAQTATAMLPRLAVPPQPGTGDARRPAQPAPATDGFRPAVPAPPPASPAAQAARDTAPPAQRVDVRVQLQGAPAGTVVTTRTPEGVRVERPMTGGL